MFYRDRNAERTRGRLRAAQDQSQKQTVVQMASAQTLNVIQRDETHGALGRSQMVADKEEVSIGLPSETMCKVKCVETEHEIDLRIGRQC